METKILTSQNPERFIIELNRQFDRTGDLISVGITERTTQNNIPPRLNATLKYVAHNPERLSVDFSGILKHFPLFDFDLNNDQPQQTPLPKIGVDVFNERSSRAVTNDFFFLLEGAGEFKEKYSLLEKRLAPPATEPNITFFKDYPQVDTSLVEDDDSNLHYLSYERNAEFVEWRDAGLTPSAYIQREIDECGIFLRWRNTWGTWSYWLFDENYTEEIKTKSLGGFVRPFTEYQNRTQRLFDFGFTGVKQWALTSKIPVFENELEEIKTLFISPEVYLYRGKKGDIHTTSLFDKEKWERVKVSAGNHKFQNDTTNPLAVTIEFQELTTLKNI